LWATGNFDLTVPVMAYDFRDPPIALRLPPLLSSSPRRPHDQTKQLTI